MHLSTINVRPRKRLRWREAKLKKKLSSGRESRDGPGSRPSLNSIADLNRRVARKIAPGVIDGTVLPRACAVVIGAVSIGCPSQRAEREAAKNPGGNGAAPIVVPAIPAVSG